MKQLLLALCALPFIAGCNNKSTPAAANAANPPAPSKAAIGAFGIDTGQMDAAVRPGDDFYRYANGKWLTSFKIPADKSRYYTFDALRDKAEADVRTLLDEVAKTTPAVGSVEKKVLDFYESWMDQKAAEARGAEPLKADFDAIAAATSKAAIVMLMGRFDYSGPVGFYVEPDPVDPTKYVVAITQSGLGMPSRDTIEQRWQIRYLSRCV